MDKKHRKREDEELLDDDALRAAAAAHLGRPVSEKFWSYLLEDEKVQTYRVDRKGLRWFLREVERLAAANNGLRQRKGETALEVPPGLWPGDPEAVRARSDYLAYLAGQCQEVIEFRRQRLPAGLLPYDAVERLRPLIHRPSGPDDPVVIAALRPVVRILADRFPWTDGEAVHFVFSGTAPQVEMLRANGAFSSDRYCGSRITLEFDLRTDVAALAHFVRWLQRDQLGKANVPLSKGRVKVFKFVLAAWQEDARGGRRPRPVSRLRAPWNDQNPADRIETDAGFCHAFAAAHLHLLGKPFTSPGGGRVRR